MLTSVFALLKYDFQREFRQRLSFLSILLYVFSITYLLYFLLNTQGALVKMEVKYWNVIFWIIILFTTINELISQFSKESDGLYLYYYTVIHPSHFIISRLIFHAVYAALISLLTYFIFSLWFGSPVENFSLILLSILLGSSSFAILFTFWQISCKFHNLKKYLILCNTFYIKKIILFKSNKLNNHKIKLNLKERVKFFRSILYNAGTKKSCTWNKKYINVNWKPTR